MGCLETQGTYGRAGPRSCGTLMRDQQAHGVSFNPMNEVQHEE